MRNRYLLAAMFLCGNILISGGTITAIGGAGSYAAGIGTGWNSICGTITISSGVTSVAATRCSTNDNYIGASCYGTCDTVTIDGVTAATTSSTFDHFNSSVDGNTWTLTHK